MECPICLELISNSCYASCSHRFCYKCLKKWCNKGGIECPLCKHRIFQIILDKEFDLKNNPTNMERLEKEYTKTIYVNFNDNKLPGITLTNISPTTSNLFPYGVIVSNLEKNKKMSEYLKLNDIILYLNGVPCIRSNDTIAIIMHYYKIGGILKIELQDTKEKEDLLLLCCSMFTRKSNR